MYYTPTNTKHWNFFEKITIGETENFKIYKNQDVEIGDKFLIYVAYHRSPDSNGVFGYGTVISNPYRCEDSDDNNNKKMVVDVQITHMNREKPYMTKKELDKILARFGKTKFMETRKIDEKYYKCILERISISENIISNDVETIEKRVYTEGREREKTITDRDRSREAREKAIDIHGTKCQVCGFDFEETYGELGKGFIIVHHLNPINQGKRDTDPDNDLACVCANCHAMMDKSNFSIEEMKILIKNNKKFLF